MMTKADRKNALTLINTTHASNWGELTTWMYDNSMFLRSHLCNCLLSCASLFVMKLTVQTSLATTISMTHAHLQSSFVPVRFTKTDTSLKSIKSWQHKELLLCSTGMTSMHLLYKLTLLLFPHINQWKYMAQ